jgi:hypothetical protein
MVLDLTAEAIGKPGIPAHSRAHGPVLALRKARRHLQLGGDIISRRDKPKAEYLLDKVRVHCLCR